MMNPQEANEIDAYIERFKDCTPEELLRYMGEARDFFWKYMTPGGQKTIRSHQIRRAIRGPRAVSCVFDRTVAVSSANGAALSASLA